jgi:hypothetical protein
VVSFRFHLVSLVAVFLALALGIGMGATVIDKATVDSLKRRVDAVEDQRDANAQQINDLNRRLSRSSTWETQAQQLLISGALQNTPVTLMAVRGVDEGVLGDQRKLLQASGANVQGTLWFPQKANLADASAIVQLQQLLGTSSAELGQLRQAFLARVSAVIAGAAPSSSLKDLAQAGFVDWEGSLTSDLADANISASRIVFMSSAQANVPNDQLATPLVKLLAAQPARRVVAVEAGRDPDARTNTSGSRSVWLDVIRKDSSLDSRLSTVDYVETDLGRTATILAVAQLAGGRTGDYGLADSAENPLPELPS